MLPVGSVVAGDGEEVIDEEKDEEIDSSELSKEEKKLAIMMMSKKRRWLYNRIMTKRHKKSQKVTLFNLPGADLPMLNFLGKRTSETKNRI